MQFCPKCGSVLVEKRKNYGCSKCSYSTKEKVNIESTENLAEKKIIGILNEKETTVWPVTSESCPKCGNKEAYFWSAQMRAGDEGETRFFKCTKCKYTWRAYH